MMGGMFVGMLLLHLVIFILIVLLWIYRKPLAEAAARDKAMADRERKRTPSRKNRPYAWVVMLSSTAVLALDMYFDMPSVGVPGLIWKGLLAGPSLTVAVTSFMWVVLAGPQRIRQYVKYALSEDVCPVWYNVVYRLLWRRGGCLFGNGDQRYGAEPRDV